MSYPGSFITWIDNSAIPSILPISEQDNSPLFGAVFTSDMGPEEWTTVRGKEFFELFGSNISFANHGQPLLQAAMLINNGAKLYCKRIVANDATYANLGVIATIKGAVPAGEPVTDEDGNRLYYQKDPATGEDLETTTTDAQTAMDDLTMADNTPVVTEGATASVSYEPFSVEGASKLDDIYDAFQKQYDPENHKYPLFMFVDNGRGVSMKSWSILPNYELSKNNRYMVYTLNITTVDDGLSTVTFTFNPDYILNGKSFCLQQRVIDTTKQLKCKQFDSYINEFIAAIADTISTEANPVTVADIKNQDLLFGFTRKGKLLSANIVYDAGGISIDSAYGNKLLNGNNGAFGTTPIAANSNDPEAETYTKAMLRAFDEDLYPDVWDNENNKIIAIFDADYPFEVKRKLEQLVLFREDFLYFEDFGTKGMTTFSEIKEYYDGSDEVKGVARSKFVKPYPIYCDILDPYTQKQITVSITYLLGIKFINHVLNGVNNPFCGIRYNITFPEVIYGTVSFIPAVTPKYDVKTQMNDERLNFVAYHNELLVMETDFTSQEEYTQWSFGCNVAATQAVVRAIRTICPINRYTVATEAGLMAYEQDIKDKVLANYVDWFDTLNFEYVGDEITLANKQYYAAISVKFYDFITEEHFKVTALPCISVSD